MRNSWLYGVAILAGGTLLAQSAAVTRQVPPPSAHAAQGVRYVDVTEAAGLSTFRHVSGSPNKNYVIEVVGSGVGVFDYNGDGRPDIYLVNGSTLDHVRDGSPGPSSALFRNDGGGHFADVTTEAGVANGRWGQGVCVGDYDNDGREDIYVTNFGVNRLYHAGKDGAFVDVAPAAGVAVNSWSTGCAFGDYDGDGLLDLFVAGYVALDPAHLPPPGSTDETSGGAPPVAAPVSADAQRPVGMGASYSANAAFCTYRGLRVACGPRGLKGAPDHLFHNNGDGTFTDVSQAAGVSDPKGLFGFGVAWTDLDDDGRLDLFVANDSGPNLVYRNAGGGRFDDVSYPSGAALDGNGRDQAHMGVAVGDYDNDGKNDLHITNFADDFNILYHNDGRMIFNDVTFQTGLGQPTLPFLGWGTDFLDYDNDGWADILVVNGHVYPQADTAPWNTSYAQRSLLFRNLGGRRFEEIGSAAGDGLTRARVSRGSAVGDLDDDGGVDVVINNLDGPPTVARNEISGQRSHWLGIRLIGDPAQKCPRDAIGSVVFASAGGIRQRGEVASGRGQISQSDLRVHFGLGAATAADLEIRWAGGGKSTVHVAAVDRVVTVDQASGREEK